MASQFPSFQAVSQTDIATIRVDAFGNFKPQIEQIQVNLGASEKDVTVLEGSETILIRPSPLPTAVIIRSTVNASEIASAMSAAAVAIQRRRRTAQIAKQLDLLDPHEKRDDFNSYLYPIFDDIRILHSFLIGYEAFEGNTCIILRYIRNSLIGREGCEAYRSRTVRQETSEILREMGATRYEGSYDETLLALEKLTEAGLRTSIPVDLVGDDDSEEEDADEGEKTEIPD